MARQYWVEVASNVGWLLWLCLGMPAVSPAQLPPASPEKVDTVHYLQKRLKVNGYIDSYYGYDFSRPSDAHTSYFVSSAQHNTFAVNLAYVSFTYQSDRFKARLIPGVGTYVTANYANEEGSMGSVIEANASVKLFHHRSIWMEGGVLASPYTNESPISKDQWMYTRSLGAEYVPYYLCGIKLIVPLSPQMTFHFYLINGWQQIKDVNRGKSIGTQLVYLPNSATSINWNTYVGDERSARRPNYRMRYFSDIYLLHRVNSRLDISTCWYYGMQSTASRELEEWWQGNIACRYAFNKTWSLSGRLEYFKDPHAVQIIPVTDQAGFDTYAAGLCLNAVIIENSVVRFDLRGLQSIGDMFLYAEHPSSRNLIFTTSITSSF